MNTNTTRKIETRKTLIDKLHSNYSKKYGIRIQLRYFRKKYAWLVVIAMAKAIKRLMDIVFSLVLILLFIPVFIVIAIIIKASDGGPVFYVSNRVGKWGVEFSFPKFRSMRIDAETQLRH